jgi:hypothetical protein
MNLPSTIQDFVSQSIKAAECAKAVASRYKGVGGFNASEGKDNRNSRPSSSQKYSKGGKSPSRNTPEQVEQKEGRPEKRKEAPSVLCWGCGRQGHKSGECSLQNHPDFNKEKVSYLQSSTHKKFLKLSNSEYNDILPAKFNSKGDRIVLDFVKKGESKEGSRRHKKKSRDEKKGMQVNVTGGGEVHHDEWNLLHEPLNRDEFVTGFIRLSNEGLSIQVKVLLDTGAIHSNYISAEMADILSNIGFKSEPCFDRVTSCISSSVSDYVTCKGVMTVNLVYFDELINKESSVELQCKIIESNIPLVIGLPTIRAEQLVQRMESFFLRPIRSGIVLENTSGRRTYSKLEQSASAAQGKARHVHFEDPETLKASNYNHIELLAAIANVSDGNPYQFDGVDPWDTQGPDSSKKAKASNELPFMAGSDDFKRRLKEICLKHKKIFSEDLNPEPAKVQPFKMEVNEDLWRRPANRAPPRRISVPMQEVVNTQIEDMLRANVIRPSQADHYSQILMVPKKDGSWRFCIDFRQLNEATKSLSWTIPHIKEMLERIGASRPKFFGVLDFLKGYYQAPMHPDSVEHTAFKCYKGTYEWLRVPMGLKGAPSYFQQQMAQKVLGGLLYSGVELYIDDILIHAETEDQFLELVEKLFARLEEMNVTISPKKCKLGVDKIEYVGHVIDSEGISYSEDKVRQVLDFATPTSIKSLQSFLGFVNFFRSNIPNLSVLEQPLNAILHKNGKDKPKFRWDDDAQTAFEEIKRVCTNLPKLFFSDPLAPVVVYTDASDHGFGSYTVQLKDDGNGNIREEPVAFLSGTFNKQQMNWPTIEKECFAIIHTLKKLDYLLRDRHFVLKTDHRNLLYLNNSNLSAKVLRWKLLTQEYYFKLEHIPGKQNVVADGLSRLMVQEYKNELLNILSKGEEEIPENKMNLIEAVHNSVTGHSGVERTLQKLKKSLESHAEYSRGWKGMRKHVKDFVDSCPTCQKNSVIQPTIESEKFTTHSYEPFERINIDTIGPIAKKDMYGNEFILCIRDTFSRFTVLYPMKSTEAKCVAHNLLLFIGTFGCPKQILSDNGSEFVNNLIEELCKLIEVEHIKTIAYSKEENSIVERGNKEVQRFLKDIIFDKRIFEEWSVYLPLIQRIINASENESTGFTPAEIVFGNSVDLDRGFLKPFERKGKKEEPSEFVQKLLKFQDQVVKTCQEKLKNHDQIHKKDQTKATVFAVGSYVLVKYPRKDGKLYTPTKQSSRWQGPYVVKEQKGNTYVLENLVSQMRTEVNVKQLKQYIVREGINLVDVASRDKDEYLVEEVIEMRGEADPKRLRQIEFLVKWMGYDQSFNTWEPYTGLRNNVKLHEFLRKENKSFLIPLEHRNVEERPRKRRRN